MGISEYFKLSLRLIRQNPAAPKKIPRHIRRIGNKFAAAHFVYFFRGDKRVGKIALGASVRP